MSETENIYGEENTFGGQEFSPPKPEESGEEPKKTHALRLHTSAGPIDVMSPIPKEQFLVDLLAEIQARGADPNFSGWYGFRVIDKSKAKNKKERTVSVMVRQIVGVEEL
tara:strand:+ start:2229 stop:2558 length:330 start_codon:yes stop_codon:yes gene_type:complete